MTKENEFFTPALKAVIVVTVLYVTAAAVGAFITANAEFIIYIAVLIVMATVISFVHYRVKLSSGALWCLTTWGFLHMAGGLMPVPKSWPINGDIRVLYSLWLIPYYIKYDHVIHAFGFGVTTWVCWQGMKAVVRNGFSLKPTFGVLTLCAAAGMGFGALNEVIEFFVTLTVANSNVGGYVNTGWDLVSNLVGTVTAAVIIRVCCRKEQ